MTALEVGAIVDQCKYKTGWHIELFGMPLYIQIDVGEASDSSLCSVARDGTRTPWKSGKHYLSQHMSRQEIVSAVWALIQDAEMHEAREWFRYRGAAIYNPHLDPDVLVEVASKASSFNMRENAMTMQEG